MTVEQPITTTQPWKPERIGLVAWVSQSWNRVTVTVPGEGAITESVLDFAEVVMLLPREPQAVQPEPGISGPTGPIAVVGTDEG